MTLVAIRHIPYGSEIETANILAHSSDEAERYLRILVENQHGNKSLTVLHSYAVDEPTGYAILSKDDSGQPTALKWKNKTKGSSGVVRLWTDLPESIKKKIQKSAKAA